MQRTMARNSCSMVDASTLLLKTTAKGRMVPSESRLRMLLAWLEVCIFSFLAGAYFLSVTLYPSRR